MTHVPSLDWRCEVASVTDGDTVRLHLRRLERLVNGWRHVVESDDPRGVPVRLIILDTPERGHVDYTPAREALRQWLETRAGRLRCETWESAGWDRLLGDVYADGDRGDTATQWMLRAGWASYVEGP